MEQILPLMDLGDPFDDPIIEANDLFETGHYEEAFRTIETLLVSDIRCLDAHAHLGNWCFRSTQNNQSFSWFNPSDNQGARFLLLDIDAGKIWKEVND
ncbi:MAG: hypothetical protein R6V00_07865 [Candidatus Aminicenantes bacterium]